MRSIEDIQSSRAWLLGTPLQLTTYADWTVDCARLAQENRAWCVEFANTQVVTMRRHEAEFRELSEVMDFTVPDGMPLIWCLNAQGANLPDRVYGPTFMRHCLLHADVRTTHYFVGASDECRERLIARFREERPEIQIVGARDGLFSQEEEDATVEEINRLSPDMIWIGLGTPKQQAWMARNVPRIQRGVLLSVGYAFDVNAGTKADAPDWMQKSGLTWLFRIASEPRRLLGRYVKYNSLFLLYLLGDGLRGRLNRPTT